MTSLEARKILEDLVAFPDARNFKGEFVYDREDHRRDRAKYLFCTMEDDNDGMYILVDLEHEYCRFEGHYYKPETLEAIAAWMRDPVGVANAT